jgi:hypothetical protein
MEKFISQSGLHKMIKKVQVKSKVAHVYMRMAYGRSGGT